MQLLGFAKTWWGQVFLLLAFLAALEKYTGFRTDVAALTNATTQTIHELRP